jgi:hypothetical protein
LCGWPSTLGPERCIKEETDRLAAVIRAANISLD